MKGFNQLLAVVGGLVMIVAVCWGIKLGYNAIEESGYERHEYEVGQDLQNGKQAALDLADKTGELNAATAKIEEMTKQLEAAKIERAALTPALKALVDLKKDNDECTTKDIYNVGGKCAYGHTWWHKHAMNITSSTVEIKNGAYNTLTVAKYEFVRNAAGDIVDFKLVPEQQAAQN